MPRVWLRFLVTGGVLAVAPPPIPSARTLASWVTLNFDWDALNITRVDAESQGIFAPGNCALTGVKSYNGRLWATVPRWRAGVPSTLNLVTGWEDGEPDRAKLVPWPSAQRNDWRQGGPTALRYVQSMEVDALGRMWVIDVGRVNIFETNPALVVNGPASLTLFDLNTDTEVARFVLPHDIAPPDSNFLNDIVVDSAREVAYISDAGGDGAIIIVDLKNQRAARFADKSTARDPSVKIVISGKDYGTDTFTTPVDGIALSPDTNWLYYCAVQSLTLYRIPTEVLRASPFDAAKAASLVEVVANKSSPADGMTFSSDGRLFSGGIADPDNEVWQWDALTATPKPFSDRSKVVSAAWADTFAFDGKGSLIWTTNRLDRYFTKTMDFSGDEGPNFRILAQYLNAYSYVNTSSAQADAKFLA